MREILSMIIVLSAICSASGFALSYLKQTSAPLIEAQVLTYVQGPAIASVYPAAENDPVAERQPFNTPDGRRVMVFPYKQGGKLLGVALENKAGGFGGDVNVMVGFNLGNDSLLGIGITEMKETPGLGTKVAEPKFTKQFIGASAAVELSARGGKVDSVSGATISSAAVIGAVKAADQDYQALKAQILQTWQ
ncbi:FMN-binding protein [Desulfovibrio sp. OttesenSCG-928-A18]|nr:FMN-binding protein [Desulfovibrio sp. OttesenSCG-928-A18]